VHCMGYIPWIRDLQDEDGDFYGTSTYKEIDIYYIPLKWFDRPDFHFVVEILEHPILNYQLYPLSCPMREKYFTLLFPFIYRVFGVFFFKF
jgi:hypothetical protein